MAISKTLNRTLFAISIVFYVTALLLYSFWNNSYQKEKILDQIDIKQAPSIVLQKIDMERIVNIIK